MFLSLEIYNSLCETKVFIINNVEASFLDFGYKYDRDSDNAEDYGCGDMVFEPKEATQEILDKYKITPDEYNIVCKELDKLSFGSCCWCV